ncbi:MAG: ribulose-phosphate 3-epimerase [Bdellovibrionales bacterium]|nr:ribulose-phosphate 3-epimerase [Bdellovibrionales bacterium]
MIAPSILSADFGRLRDEIQAVEDAGADWIHVDVMDGHFVPNLTLGPPVIACIRKVTTLPLDVHLMIEKPQSSISQYADAGADWITIHQEADAHLHRAVDHIKKLGIKAGVSINPASPVSLLENILQDLDLVLVMSVNPGFGGQSFLPFCLDKVKQLRNQIDQNSMQTLIEIDGGINSNTLPLAMRSGAEVFVAGSAVFRGTNYKKNIEDLRNSAAQNS